MKIIQTDNFDRDDIGDQLLADNVSKYWAERIVTLLNDKYSGSVTDFYCQAVSDNYKLKEGFTG